MFSKISIIASFDLSRFNLEQSFLIFEMTPLERAMLSTFFALGAVTIGAGISAGIALLAWVARDARAHGMESIPLWIMLVMATGFIGLLVYLFSRPSGVLEVRGNCAEYQLQTSQLCPSCGHIRS